MNDLLSQAKAEVRKWVCAGETQKIRDERKWKIREILIVMYGQYYLNRLLDFELRDFLEIMKSITKKESDPPKTA